MRISPRKPNTQSWTKTDFSLGRETKQVRSNCAAWTQTQTQNECRGGALETNNSKQSKSPNQSAPPTVSVEVLEAPAPEAREVWGGEDEHGLEISTSAVPWVPADYLLGGFKTREAPTRFRPGLTTNIRTPWPFLNSNTGSLGFHRFYEIYFFLLKCKRANENEVWMQRQETGSAVFGCLGEMHCTDTACRTSLHLSVHSFI